MISNLAALISISSVIDSRRLAVLTRHSSSIFDIADNHGFWCLINCPKNKVETSFSYRQGEFFRGFILNLHTDPPCTRDEGKVEHEIED